MRFELTTSTLARLRSTPELRPHTDVDGLPLGQRRSYRAKRPALQGHGPAPVKTAQPACTACFSASSASSARMASQVSDPAKASSAAKISSASPILSSATTSPIKAAEA